MNRRLVILAGDIRGLPGVDANAELDDIMKGVEKLPKSPAARSNIGVSDDNTNAAGIKEALATGTGRALASLSRKAATLATRR